MKKTVRCTYMGGCYLADELRCYGFMADCPLYMRSNGEPCNEARFHAAMDRLITATRAKHEQQNRVADESEPKVAAPPETP